MRARWPRSKLRLSPEELLPGEHGAIKDFSIRVASDRRVYVEKTTQMYKIFGRNEWPDERETCNCLIKKDDSGYTLIALKNFDLMPNDPIDYRNYLAISNLIFINEEQVCPTCKGFGFTK